ncbi:type II toxin-antitoxin system RelE/ParE family toxin [Algoriphagus aquimarinus]|uniref:type II toxin-antitoxin system RelE/ParE family toxin n=1 Tax=Algoriphagus aquimarinus TaxID=237018 RepID=UPI0030DB0A53|tara:strand:+ start:969 stop:1268 length:300 start_codon:yes stop_codon:yes gene_type:complete
MARKQIVWSNLASTELASILDFYTVRNNSSRYSLKLLDEIEKVVSALIDNEHLGRLATNKFTRILPFKYYLIFYEVNQHQIEIISIWDNRQNPERKKVH